MCSPPPVRCARSTAASEAHAAAKPDWNAAWWPCGFSGGNSGSCTQPGASQPQPPPWTTCSSSARQSAHGPVCPNGVIDIVTSDGCCARSDSGIRSSSAAARGARSWMNRSASPSNLSSVERPSGCERLATTLRLFVLIAANNPPMSPWSPASGRYGPRRRAGSPSGGSTLMTSAPRSASSFAVQGAATICPNSTTRMPSRPRAVIERSGARSAIAHARPARALPSGHARSST